MGICGSEVEESKISVCGALRDGEPGHRQRLKTPKFAAVASASLHWSLKKLETNIQRQWRRPEFLQRGDISSFLFFFLHNVARLFVGPTHTQGFPPQSAGLPVSHCRHIRSPTNLPG